MKRFVVPLLALFAVLAPLTASAGQWVQKEIFWSKGGAVTNGNPGASSGGAVGVHDTLYAPYPLKTSGSIDTTGKFTLRYADIFRSPHAGPATGVDTMVAGWLVITQDSTAAPVSTVSSLTYKIDGRAGGFKLSPTDTLQRGYVQVDSSVATFVNNVPYNTVLTIPLRIIGGVGILWGGNNPEAGLNFGYKLTAFEDLRCRITSVTGIMSGNLRAFFRYWDSDPVPATEGNR